MIDNNNINSAILPRLQRVLLETLDFNEVVQRIVNKLLSEPSFQEYGYRIVVLSLFDETKQVLKRISLSSTPEATKTLQVSAVPFEEIEIPINADNNLLVKSFKEKKPKLTHFWPDLFVPVLTPEQALTNQTNAEIKTSLIYPIIVKEKSIGTLIFSMIKNVDHISEEEHEVLYSFADVVGIALQNSQLFTSLKKANEELKELNKMKDEFVFIATHDLKTPVTAIDGYISLIEKKQPKFSEDIEKNFEEVKAASDRLKQLVNDLLQVARGESGTIKVEIAPVDIDEIITKVQQEVQVIADNKKVKLITNFDPSVKMVLGDALKLPEIIENLMSNAIKFNNPDGNVVVTTKKADKFLEIAIADTGHGIPIAEQPKVFEKFFKYRNEKTQDIPGTGLGLFVVKMLIEKMGGRISFTSAEEKGTTFTFTLPLAS
jgi:signal transduction histidine kinase